MAADTQGTLLGTCGCSGLDHQGSDAKKVKKHVVRLERSVEVGGAIHPWLRRGVTVLGRGHPGITASTIYLSMIMFERQEASQSTQNTAHAHAHVHTQWHTHMHVQKSS